MLDISFAYYSFAVGLEPNEGNQRLCSSITNTRLLLDMAVVWRLYYLFV